MPEITFLLASAGEICAGGGHAHITITVDGGAAQRFMFEPDDIRSALSDPDERKALLRAILKLHFAGATRAQVRAALLAGVTVTI